MIGTIGYFLQNDQKKLIIFFETNSEPYMCACVWLLRVAYSIPPGSLLFHGGGCIHAFTWPEVP